MVEHEVRMGHEIQAYRHVIQPVCIKRISGLENSVEIVGVPVIPDEAEDAYPHIGLGDISLKPRSLLVFGAWEDKWHRNVE
eukprot:CAMPEP_0197482404 /NCGR_PEP_ID=MMETSP1309-20131121/54862_1 /TAXON_ID=464262 /ORGANISM="Genus nov. species nov., Strain RCC998" /LENGTH=80 /DNA_ID=CAMNT_0043024903 /DNA_START=360 /DNA_END=602 /DNA_ORIENTATION=-